MAAAISVTTSYTIYDGETLTYHNQNPFDLVRDYTTAIGPGLTIDGELDALWDNPNVNGAFAEAVQGGSLSPYPAELLIGENGVLHVSSEAPAQRVWAFFATGVTHVENRGLVDVSSGSDGTALQGQDVTVENSGEIKVYALGHGSGVFIERASFVNTGTIEVTSGFVNPDGGLPGVGVRMQDSGCHFENDGVIRALEGQPGAVTVGVYWMMDQTDQSTWVNRGTIEGDYALVVRPNQIPWPGEIQTLDNEGQLIGRVDLGAGGQMLVNAGAVAGDVLMGDGDDVYDGGRGSVVGLIAGNVGNDHLMGGAVFDRMNGNTGDDTVEGGGGDDWVTGGQDNDQLLGGDDADILNGNLGADTGDGGAGNDTVRGGQAADVLSGGAGDDYVTGDLGDDTLSGGAGADAFRAFAGGGSDVITDFNAGEGDHVVLDPGTDYVAAQSGSDVVVELGAGAELTLKNVQLAALPSGWITGA